MRTLAAMVTLLLAAPAWSGTPDEWACRFTGQDQADVRAVVEAYRTAWLKGDAKAVLATFTEDAVLLPAHGAKPVVGHDAISRYWWPADGPPTRITRLDITVDGLEGDCGIAYAHGRDDVAWTQVENGVSRAHGHPGTYLNVFAKSRDGQWRIARHMWDDGPSEK
jgi:uncharacterized protein (TIGR02246 family)